MAERDTQALPANLLGLKVAAGAVIERGQLVCVNIDGYAEVYHLGTQYVAPAAGRCEASVDNTDGEDGDATVTVRPGVYYWDNDGDDPVTQAMVGQACYALDLQSVSASQLTRPVAGIVLAVDASGVWVKTGL